jgi:serine protease Do
MLPTLVAQTPINQKVSLTIFRKGHKQKVNIKIGKLNSPASASQAIEQKTAHLGLTVQELTPEIAEAMHIHIQKGIIVTNVKPASQAAYAGFVKGDIIIEINQITIKDMDDLTRELARTAQAKKILFLIKRGDTTRYMVVKNK